MGSLGGEVGRKKAMVVYPKAMEAHPSERWGHSACYFNGLLYVFGGCRGGVHFSDVLVCSLETMTWNILETSGSGPGPRDSHSAVLVGSKMIVFGGTNGSKKVNDLHILDLLTRVWTHPECRGNPPCARESHTANVVGDEKMIVFGGSGEGEANYLSDLHILDLMKMEWTSPEVRGHVPAPRDSHSSVVVGDRLFVCGGDSGDRYQCDVCVLDLNRSIWSTMDGRGPLPSARAGHASVSIGTKMYVLGGVGDKHYYNDIWVLDVITSSSHQLDTSFQKSQGRFSHTATVTNLGIAVFGGCGEDERPLSELLILQIDSPASNSVGNMDNKETKIFLRQAPRDLPKTTFVGDSEDLERKDVPGELASKQTFRFGSDMLHPKRRRTSNSKILDTNPESVDQSFPLSQHSSPSKSGCEKMIRTKSNRSSSSPRVHPLFRQKISTPSRALLNLSSDTARTCGDIRLSSDHSNQRKQELANVVCNDHACEVQCKAVESSSHETPKTRNMIGAEVRGQVDGAFDSGYLMTAVVNGTVYRGVLFPPGPDLVSRGAVLGRCPSSFVHHTTDTRGVPGKNLSSFSLPRHSQQHAKVVDTKSGSCFEGALSRRSSPENRASAKQGPRINNNELQGVVLTLGGPGTDNSRL
ncbi:uncharacterized protein [Henckelia pumila]|uniref:uncharacterized protein n=1 Tax=Henckelia pumila TaxID=405737 RepID=UPI003C6E28A4